MAVGILLILWPAAVLVHHSQDMTEPLSGKKDKSYDAAAARGTDADA